MWGPVGTFRRLRRSVQAFARELARPTNFPPVSPVAQPKIGIALGGGFARGLAHIGVLKVLEEASIPTSVGAVIGAAYCSGMNAEQLAEMAGQVRFRDFARWTISRYGFASNTRLANFLRRVVKAKTFEELQVPLAVTATDFLSGEGVVFSSGPLIEPVRASCAYPGMFLPVEIKGRLLVDGMLAHTVPAQPLREMGADRVLGIYLRAHWCAPTGPKHIFEVIGQCFSIAQARMSGVWRSAADLVVEPDVAGFGYDAFERAPELIRAGEVVMREALPAVQAWLAQPQSQLAEQRPASRLDGGPQTSPHACRLRSAVFVDPSPGAG
jgi:NTE family protein